MENKQLAQLYKTNLPLALKEAISEVLNEDEAYVADELVELCETVLFGTSSAWDSSLPPPTQPKVGIPRFSIGTFYH